VLLTVEGLFTEVVVFALQPGVTRQAFLDASRPAREWYLAQPGNRGSELIEGSDGRWVGLLRWDDLASSERAQARIGEEIAMDEFMAIVDPERMVFIAGPVVEVSA
jgi:hypothetical protein